VKALIRQFGWLRTLALAFACLPVLVLPVLGVLWLWQSARLGLWLLLVAAVTLTGWLLNRLAVAREQRELETVTTSPGSAWPQTAETCWVEVEAFAAAASPADWPLNDGARMWELARTVLRLVAEHLHPHARDPLLQMTLPHTLAVIERAARELRVAIAENVPASHKVTLGQVAQARQLGRLYEQNQGWIRVITALVAPENLIAREVRGQITGQIFQYGSERVQGWLLRQYILKLGYHAIELYGGLVRLDDDAAVDTESARSRVDSGAAEAAEAIRLEPVRILVLGRANAGKSSLINALFGELRAATDLLPDTTTGIEPYRLDREDELRALIFDTPGFDGLAANDRALVEAAASADLLLWVTAANRPDRAEERLRLDALREQLADPNRRAPPLLVVMTHIDRLRPVREWAPPYVLDPPAGAKATGIVAAMAAVAADLRVEPGQIVPVCLADDRLYNVEDALWAAMLAAQPEAERVRLLRCLRAQRRTEDWALLWRQLANAGRILRHLPDAWKG